MKLVFSLSEYLVMLESKFCGVEGVGDDHSFCVSQYQGKDFFGGLEGKKSRGLPVSCCGRFACAVLGIECCPDIS